MSEEREVEDGAPWGFIVFLVLCALAGAGVGVGAYSLWIIKHQPEPQTVVVASDQPKLAISSVPTVDRVPQDAQGLVILGRVQLKALEATMKGIQARGYDVAVVCDESFYCSEDLSPGVKHKLDVTVTKKL